MQSMHNHADKYFLTMHHPRYSKIAAQNETFPSSRIGENSRLLLRLHVRKIVSQQFHVLQYSLSIIIDAKQPVMPAFFYWLAP